MLAPALRQARRKGRAASRRAVKCGQPEGLSRVAARFSSRRPPRMPHRSLPPPFLGLTCFTTHPPTHIVRATVYSQVHDWMGGSQRLHSTRTQQRHKWFVISSGGWCSSSVRCCGLRSKREGSRAGGCWRRAGAPQAQPRGMRAEGVVIREGREHRTLEQDTGPQHATRSTSASDTTMPATLTGT